MSATGGSVSFSFEPTAQDNARAAALLAGRHPMRKAGPPLVIMVSLLVGLLLALASAKFYPGGDARRVFGLSAAMCALFLGLQYLMLLRIALNTTRASIESLGWTGRQIEAVIGRDGVTFDGERTRLVWRDLRQVIAGPEHMVLISSTGAPLVIPQRALGEHARNLLLAAQVRA